MKSHFVNQLYAAPIGHYRGRSTWRLIVGLHFYYEPLKTRFSVPPGFVTDFASVPRMPFIWWLMSDYGHPAAVVHDYLCERRLYPRKFVDNVFFHALLACGVPRWRAALMYSAVRSYATVKGL